MKADDLRVEHLDHPLGMDTRSPRLSWRLPPGSSAQVAYRLRADNGWDSGRVASPDNLLVPYGGPALGSAQRVSWRVKVWTDQGEGGWSRPAWFETGLLDAWDWSAVWIEPAEAAPARPGERPGHLLRRQFSWDGPVGRARLYVTAHGIYEAFLNGIRVGDAELTPGYTQYRTRLQVQTYDVTDLIHSGHNVLAIVLADGWFRGQTGALRSADQWGDRVAVLAQLNLHTADGTQVTVGTGPGWRGAVGHVVAADLIAGERVDLGARPDGWTGPGFDDAAWAEASIVHYGYSTLVASPAPPVRRVEEIVPVAVTRPEPGRQVVDLGQNINGWVRLSRLGPAGTRIVLTHGEHLDAGGCVTTDHLRPAFPFLPEPLPAGMVDEVVSAGRSGEVFEPRRTTHGFRYVQIDGLPERLRPRRCPRDRGPHRHATHRLVRVQRRPGQRAARGGRVEPARQRLRHPDRLSAAGTGRLDRRLAAVRTDRRLSLRRGRVLHQVAARRRGRPVARRHRGEHEPVPAGGGAGLADRPPQRIRRLGRRRRHRRRGSSTGRTATSGSWPSCGRPWWPGSPVRNG